MLVNVGNGASLGNGSGFHVKPPSTVEAMSPLGVGPPAPHENPVPDDAPCRLASDAIRDCALAIARTASLGCAGGVVVVDGLPRSGRFEHSGGLATVIDMFPITEQCSASAHERAEFWEIPNPTGSAPGVQDLPPSVVLATTPAVQSLTPIASLVPTTVQSRFDEHESDSMESPGMIGVSVNVEPPSAVERNVASLWPAI
jgi:hypothetical protein